LFHSGCLLSTENSQGKLIMASTIPGPIMAVVADIASDRETHATLDNLFVYAGAPEEAPPGSKQAKALAWLRAVNKKCSSPLEVLGRIIETYIEETIEGNDEFAKSRRDQQERLKKALANGNLTYVRGGRIVGALGAPSLTLMEYIRNRDLIAVQAEFDRALAGVESDPREAVSAASNILESICRAYIEDEDLDLPAKQDLRSLWSTVRKHLGFDPSKLEEQDLQQILSGLISVTDGIGSLRTHASSAHGAGKRPYKLEPRHARLAVHSAHTIGLFVLESWQKKKLQPLPPQPPPWAVSS